MPEPAVSLKGGRISGRLRAPAGSVVHLYRLRPLAPASADPARLVGAAAPDAAGGFLFSGLSSGDYVLAVSAPLEALPARKEALRVSGLGKLEGALRLSPKSPSLTLPLVSVERR